MRLWHILREPAAIPVLPRSPRSRSARGTAVPSRSRNRAAGGGRHAPRCGTPAGAAATFGARRADQGGLPRRTRHGAARQCWCETSATPGARSAGRRWSALTIVTTVGLGLGLVPSCSRFSTPTSFAWTRCATRTSCSRSNVSDRPTRSPRRFTRAQYDTLVRETDVFSDAFATTADVDAWIEGTQEGGPARHGELLPGPRRRRRARARAHTVGRRARRPSGHRPQPSRLVPAFCERSRRARPPGPGERSAVPGRRRDAGGLSRTRAVAAPDFWAPLSLLGQFRRGQQEREDSGRPPHRRAAEARCVARSGARAAPSCGTRGSAAERCRRAGLPRASCSNRGRARSRCRPTPCWCSCRSFLRSA